MCTTLRVAAGQQGKRTPGADDIHRLPQAVQHQHRLIKGELHTGPWQ
jgi:hypothetical protein